MRRPPKKNAGNQYADALERLARAEAKLNRAFTAWVKARALVRSTARKLDTLEADAGVQS